jgi:two-component system sensor histidine kinase SenX3
VGESSASALAGLVEPAVVRATAGPADSAAPAPRTPAGADVSVARGEPAAQSAPVTLPAKLVRRLVAGLPSGMLVVDAEDAVVLANPVARRMGVVSATRILVDDVRDLVARTRVEHTDVDTQLDLPPMPEPPLTRPRPDAAALAVRVRTRMLDGEGHVAVVLDDITETRRVEAVRRDFVANVSHELKTPVGALHLLAEAVAAASDDPTAVRRFASLMTRESTRLGRLVQEIIDLSRLQRADPMPHPTLIEVATILAEAVDRTTLAAQARNISIVVIGDGELTVGGDDHQLATAVSNLLDNAISYSPEGTRVVLGVRRSGNVVEISVADEGIGISEKDQERVFERFYRADPARSRETGGTGLGLAIVKHIATNHGGTVGVWSAEGAGSTFTLRLPFAVMGETVADETVADETAAAGEADEADEADEAAAGRDDEGA